VTARPGDLLPTALERVRRERGPFASDDDLLLATFYNREQYAKLVAARPIETDYPIGRTPLVTLVRELAARRDIAAVRLERKGAGRRRDATA
jgi:oxaloacetate decarboxylase alpha subunit